MRKLDSFFREAQCFEGLGILNMPRLVLKPFTFSNGLSVPLGATWSVAMRPAHYDEENYADAALFNPLRFLDRTEDNESESRH
ncbi:cytochrome P450 monooxygenase 116 [Heterobasidion irregulare TC 32-1]|uniref:Cytochrome P450 monooxygenase 116 n=1 Tax=Heterobasidion irregulare (strain TC 32-1) TaxID=747525 RepID=W4KAU1_HETIT|nr:cytochrome P450 monooxygenase 116 [Heterobasidion irregulare TC 32-1]ETW82839.1 cytochrome P450 monooxygenase 116 [Heterobasidion irregulare TC 32-1]